MKGMTLQSILTACVVNLSLQIHGKYNNDLSLCIPNQDGPCELDCLEHIVLVHARLCNSLNKPGQM